MARDDIQKAVDEVKEVAQEAAEEFVSLAHFAQSHALKYGVELMGGFYHSQETAKPPHLADTEKNWHDLIDKFSNKEVK